MTTIIKRQYLAFYRAGRYELEAESLYAAKLAAVAYFKPARKDSHNVTVMLADVEHSTVSL